MGSLKTVWRYPGGKSRYLTPIMEQLKPLVQDSEYYIEPFVGGGSVFLEVASTYPDKKIFINDKNYGVASFWTIVTGGNDLAVQDLCKLITQQPTAKLHAKLRSDKNNDPIMAAYKAIFFNRCNFSGIEKSGMIGGEKQEGKYKIDCRYNADKIIKRIMQINEVTRNRVVVSNLDINDYFLLWESSYPAYLDPPYAKAGPELYTHYFEEQEHRKLAAKLQNRPNWLLSYDDHALIRELYGNNSIADLNVKYSIDGTKTCHKQKNELLIKK